MRITESIRILIVDDHPVVRCGLRALADKEADLEVVAGAVDGVEAVRAFKPDVILMDLVMPRRSGSVCIRRRRRR